jgi:hypothetical protein
VGGSASTPLLPIVEVKEDSLFSCYFLKNKRCRLQVRTHDAALTRAERVACADPSIEFEEQQARRTAPHRAVGTRDGPCH